MTDLCRLLVAGILSFDFGGSANSIRRADARNASLIASRRSRLPRLPLRWVNEQERLPAVFAIDHEIGIERQHGVLLIDFGHPHDACIG